MKKKLFIGILAFGINQGFPSTHIPDLVSTFTVYVIPGPLTGGTITGVGQLEMEEIAIFTAFGLSGTHSLENAPLNYNEEGDVVATRTPNYAWSASGGIFLEGTNTSTVMWEAPKVEEATTFTINCTVSEGTVTIGRPFGITYGPRTATTQLTILVTPLIPHTVQIEPETIIMAVEETQTIKAKVFNKQGKLIPMPSHRYTWSTTIGTLTQVIGAETIFFAGTQAGTGAVQLKIKNTTLMATATVVILPGSPTTVEIIPGSATVPVGGTASFRMETYDSYNNFIGIPGTWTLEPEIGTLSSYFGTETIFTAGEEEGVTILKVEAEGLEGVATITIFIKLDPILKYIIPIPSSITTTVTGSATVKAMTLDQYGDQMSGIQLSWELAGVEGTITPVGTDTSLILIEFGTKTGIGTLTVSAQAETITVTVTIPIMLESEECTQVFFKPQIQELHIGPGANPTVGTYTEGTVTVFFKDKYGNDVDRKRRWTLYINLNRSPTQSGGMVLFPNSTHPYGNRIIYIEKGNTPVDIPVRIDPKIYGELYFHLCLFKRPYTP